MDYVDLYLKEKNLLQLPVFLFSKPVPNETIVEWQDGELNCKLACSCKFGVPGPFEQDVYSICMRIWIEQDMPLKGIEASYAEIARKLNLTPAKNWAGKVKNALEKLAMARYEFIWCFIKGKKRKEKVIFSLFDSAHLFDGKAKGANRRTGKSKLYFPTEIKENLEAKYYQFLDMAWYKALPSGLPRRLYEFLAKHRYHCRDMSFQISEETLCRWLPVNDTNTTTRRKTLNDVAQSLVEAGFLESYKFDSDRKICTFTYSEKLPPVAIPFTTEPAPTTQLPDGGNVEPNQIDSQDDSVDAENRPETAQEEKPVENANQSLIDGVMWLNSIPYMRPATVQALASSPGFLERYSAIRTEFDRQAGNIESPAAWIRAAFKNNYSHIKTKQEQHQEEKIELENAEKNIREVLQGKTTYRGKRFDVFDPGLLVDGKVVMWKHVDITKLA